MRRRRVAGEPAANRDFAEFVAANWSELMSIGHAVAGGHAEAEDLVQTALAKVYPRWHAAQGAHAMAYLRRTIVNAHISGWRKHRGAELVMAQVPEQAATDQSTNVDARLTLLPLVRELPPKQRAVIVLRYLCDLSDDAIAETLKVSPVTVRTQAARALQSLRAASLREGAAFPEPADAGT